MASVILTAHTLTRFRIAGILVSPAPMQAPKATIDHLEAKSSLKSPNISDGLAVGAPAGGNVSTKLKVEEVKD